VSNWAVGSNVPGYLPTGTVSVTSDADEAKRMLIHELKFCEGYAESEAIAEEYNAAAEDVNLMSVPLTVVVDGIAYWVAETDEEADEG